MMTSKALSMHKKLEPDTFLEDIILTMFLPKFLPVLALLAMALADESTPWEHETPKTIQYLFDQNVRGMECQKALERINIEDFRLFCINQRQGFQQCSLLCSEVLHFESSLGVCRPDRCNFFGTTFKAAHGGGEIKPTPGKVTLFAFSPTWEGHAQYAYELLEYVLDEYKDTTEALVLPIDIHDYALTHPRFESTPFEAPLMRRVRYLEEIAPQEISGHPFLNFVRTLLHRSGAKNFDVYTDRFVIFVMSADGTLAKRMVAPTLDELREVINEFGGKSTTTTKVM